MNLQDPASIGVLVLAWITMVGAVGTASIAAFVKIRGLLAAINGVGARATAAQELAKAAAAQLGGGAIPAARGAPVWNQLNDPLSNGMQPAWGAEECGEECCAMVVFAQHGVPVSADALRALIGGSARGPLTNGADLVAILAACNVHAQASSVQASKIAGELLTACQSGFMCIVLGRWVVASVDHWVLVTRADGAGCSANDPWGGRRRSWTWGAFRPLYSGQLVIVTRPEDDA